MLLFGVPASKRGQFLLAEALITFQGSVFSTVRGSGWPRPKTRNIGRLGHGHPLPRTVLNSAAFRLSQLFLLSVAERIEAIAD